MRKIVLIALLFCLFGLPELLSQVKPVATLEITFKGLRNNKGIVAIGLHNSPKGWHKKPEMEPNWSKEDMKDGTLTVRLENLEYGTYAFSMMDDEDANLKMDKFMGLPREGFAFSRNPKVGMSVPKFDECSFIVDTTVVELVVEVIYKGKGT
jgi:uncharacterized protein (DUF2141 family)